MSTRKVKDAVDKQTNEKIYFKGHAKATYMSDGRNVEDVINSIGTGGEGGSGDIKEVYVGDTQPTDENIELWIDTDEEEVGGGSITLDSEMSDESQNAVQNKVIKSYIDSKIGDIDDVLDNIIGDV